MSEQMPQPPDRPKIRGLWVGKRALPEKSLTLLHELAALVRKESVLDLQIRDGSINVYYRGGSLWKIEGISSGKHIRFGFDERYSKLKNPLPHSDTTAIPEPTADPREWLEKRMRMQRIMDAWFKEKPKEEREIQQTLCSNHLRHHDSEWVILDVEYAAWLYGTKEEKDGDGRRRCNFDFVAFRRLEPAVIYLVELKVSRVAMRGPSGAESHAEDFAHFLKREQNGLAREAFRKSMRRILTEKAA